LGLPQEKIEESCTLHDMGLDSLMGVELVLAMEKRFGVKLPVMILSEHPTLSRLGKKILELLEQGLQTECNGSAASTITQIARQHGVDSNSETFARLAEDIRASRFASATTLSTHR